MINISENLNNISADIVKVCKKYQKNYKDINLIAVSKTILSDKIEDAIKWGIVDFGENRVEEAMEKWPKLKEEYPKAILHMIGHLQSKKVKNAVKLFDFIHSLDSLKLAYALKFEMEKQKKFLKIFIQVNLANEDAKTGIKLEDVDEFIDKVQNEVKLPIFGLMCIPPANKEPSLYFALLNKIAKKHNIANLSMGMSSDYGTAIALNSNYIRVGQSIFGQRRKKNN